jgi:hypothetical protein
LYFRIDYDVVCFGELDGGGCEGNSHNGNSIVIKDGRDIFGREFVCSVADQKTSLANSTVTDNHTSANAYR